MMAAALGAPFLRCVGLQSIDEELVMAKRFIQRYNMRFRKEMPREKHNQRIAILPSLPEE